MFVSPKLESATVHSPVTAAEPDPSSSSEETLRQRLLKQIEYYFSRKNLANDAFLVSQMNSELFVPIPIIAGFAKIQALTKDEALITEVMKSSSQLIVDEANRRVRPNFQIQRTTVILRDIPSDTDQNVVIELLKGPNLPTIKGIKPDFGNTWYITMETEAEALDMLNHIRLNVTWNGMPIAARLKSENLLKSFRDAHASSIAELSPVATTTTSHPTADSKPAITSSSAQSGPFYPPTMSSGETSYSSFPPALSPVGVNPYMIPYVLDYYGGHPPPFSGYVAGSVPPPGIPLDSIPRMLSHPAQAGFPAAGPIGPPFPPQLWKYGPGYRNESGGGGYHSRYSGNTGFNQHKGYNRNNNYQRPRKFYDDQRDGGEYAGHGEDSHHQRRPSSDGRDAEEVHTQSSSKTSAEKSGYTNKVSGSDSQSISSNQELFRKPLSSNYRESDPHKRTGGSYINSGSTANNMNIKKKMNFTTTSSSPSLATAKTNAMVSSGQSRGGTGSRRLSQPHFAPDSFPALNSNASAVPSSVGEVKAYSVVAAENAKKPMGTSPSRLSSGDDNKPTQKVPKKMSNKASSNVKHEKPTTIRSDELSLAHDLILPVVSEGKNEKPTAAPPSLKAPSAKDVNVLTKQLHSLNVSPSPSTPSSNGSSPIKSAAAKTVASYAEMLRKPKNVNEVSATAISQ